ncbi:MAG: adenylyltransferase/cytidyltransferase family protein [Chloroflexi bacterium]|nr:adenylyltransferase/cytidyltransferase family protein [Chloroflexota bacterium]
MAKKVFVSGIFDLLHSGHIAFFEEAATYGDLYVSIGSDKTVYELKNRPPVNPEQERLYMVRSISCVKDAFIASGSGLLDFEKEFRELRPDLMIVTEDSNIPAKRALCEECGVEYLILKREPHKNLPARSSTALRSVCCIPYRIDIAGGWLDQPYVSKHYPGPVITVSIEPTIEFNERSGMATSTRRSAIELWGTRLPAGDPFKLAKILFCYDNPPGTKIVSGSQDAIGIVCPGLNKSDYACGEYWPSQIHSVQDESILQMIEQSLYLIPLGSREAGYDVLSNTHIDRDGAKALATAAEDCWDALLAKDLVKFGDAFRRSFEAQICMFPNMVTNTMRQLIEVYRGEALGWKVSGAGGGGYLILVADHPIENAMKVVVRRKDHELQQAPV